MITVTDLPSESSRLPPLILDLGTLPGFNIVSFVFKEPFKANPFKGASTSFTWPVEGPAGPSKLIFQGHMAGLKVPGVKVPAP